MTKYVQTYVTFEGEYVIRFSKHLPFSTAPRLLKEGFFEFFFLQFFSGLTSAQPPSPPPGVALAVGAPLPSLTAVC